ncbi:MAG: DUF3362 domain-containing protein, partial [Chitinimonas sp.]|nr:DUF3362 domain-containing protein [Chitinimonas sp.]
SRSSEKVDIVRDAYRRKLHKAFLRYHDPKHWPILREALSNMGRADLIGNGSQHLVPHPTAEERQLQAPRGNARGGGGPGTVGRIAPPRQPNLRGGKGKAPSKPRGR